MRCKGGGDCCLHHHGEVIVPPGGVASTKAGTKTRTRKLGASSVSSLPYVTVPPQSPQVFVGARLDLKG